MQNPERLNYDMREFDRWCREIFPELSSFTAACFYETRRRAGLTLDKSGQSVGRSIDNLETQLAAALNGGKLVNPREERKVSPTDAGKLVLNFCNKVAAARDEFLSALATMQKTSEVRIATTNYAWRVYGSELERVYREQCPDGVLNYGDSFYLQDRVWDEIETSVRDQRADVGIYSYPPTRQKAFPDDLEGLKWIEEEIVLVLPKGLARLFRQPPYSVYELSQLLPRLPKVVHYHRQLGFDRTRLIEEYLLNERVMPRFEGEWLTEASTIEEIKATLVEKGGISFLPWPTVAQEHAKGTLVAYPLNRFMRPRTLWMISRKGCCRPAVDTFLAVASTKLGGKRGFPRPAKAS